MLVYGLDNETFDSFYFFKNLEIKREINKLDISCFEIPKDYRNIFETECKVIENKQSYTIKNIEPFYDGYKIECKQNIDEWLSFFHKSLNFPYKDIETMIKGIIPSGWSYKISGEIKKYRTITADHKSSWEALEEIVKKFDVEFRIDNNEKMLFISEEIGEDKGVFFSDNFNVVDKDISVESFEFATRIIPEGMNGLKINQINDGKDYLENKSYSGKTITYYWKDERYTNIQNLKDEAERKLEVLSRPRITIKLKVKDLSKAIGVYEQEYSIGDYVYLIDKDRKTKERFRILAETIYPNRPFNNEITLANKPLDLVNDVDENIELTKEMWEETRGRFEATENLIKGYLENSKRYTDDSFKTYKSEREQTDSKIYESITESTTYVDPETGQTKPIIDKQLEIIKSVNGIKISVKNNADNLDKKISKEDVLEDEEIQEALRGKDGANGVPGQDGKDGMPGKPGADGKTSYMHFAYSDSQDGVVGFTLTATSGKKYIGFYTDFTKEDSKDPTKYEWSKYVGDDGKPGKDGINGIPGKAGADGKTPYFHTAWANSSDGIKDFSTSYAGEKLYIGTYTDFVKEDSADHKKYTWQLVKGNKGDKGEPGKQGVPGLDGKDGHTLTVETWLEGEFRNYKTKDVKRIILAKYDGEPINLTDSNTEVYNCYGDGKWDKKNLSDYWANWDRQYEYIANKVIVTYKGLKAEAYARLDNIKDGDKGEPGKAGADGKTPYFHTAWANSSDGSKDFSTSQAGEKLYIGTYTDFTKADSTDFKKYTWQLVKGNKGEPGKDGKNINRNYINNSKFKAVTVPKNLYDEAYNIDPSFWDTYNRQAMTLSFWFRARESKTYKRNFNVHFRAAPWYQFGTVVYPENTTENIFYKLHIGSKMMPQDYRAAQIFIRFIEGYSRDAFEIKDLKLEFGNEATDWIPSVNDLKGKDGEKGEPGKQGIPGKNGIDGKDGKTGKIGQNLLRNSNVPVSNKNYPTNIWTLCETPTTGETMTFTVKIKMEKDDSVQLINSDWRIPLIGFKDLSKDYKIWSKTFKWVDKREYNGKTYEQKNPPSLHLYIASNVNRDNKNTVSLEWATLTRGDIPAIEWSPCYADVEDSISEKADQESLQDLQVHFAMYPTAEELNQNQVDLMKQQAYLDQLKTAIDSSALSLEDRLSIIEANVGAGKLSLEAINTYLHFGEEGVLIGKEGEQVRLRLINNALEITDGSKVVARFANNQTETPNLKVSGAFEFGYHVASKVDLDGNKYTVISSNI